MRKVNEFIWGEPDLHPSDYFWGYILPGGMIAWVAVLHVIVFF